MPPYNILRDVFGHSDQCRPRITAAIFQLFTEDARGYRSRIYQDV